MDAHLHRFFCFLIRFDCGRDYENDITKLCADLERGVNMRTLECVPRIGCNGLGDAGCAELCVFLERNTTLQALEYVDESVVVNR